MSKHNNYTFEEKINAIRMYMHLKNAAETGRILGINASLITIWYRQYQVAGPKSLLPLSTSVHHDLYNRIFITEEILKKNLSLVDASAIFGVAACTLRRWVRVVKKQGFTGLFDKIPSNAVPNMAKKKKSKESLTELEQLREENLRLRAELDLIKKVDALVSERCKRVIESVQKPSKN